MGKNKLALLKRYGWWLDPCDFRFKLFSRGGKVVGVLLSEAVEDMSYKNLKGQLETFFPYARFKVKAKSGG